MKKGIQELLERHNKRFQDQQIYCNDIEILIEELAQELNLSKTQVRKIVDSEFKMLREVMSNHGLLTSKTRFEDLKSLRIIRLGSFRPSEKKFQHIKDFLIKQEQNGTSDTQ